MRTVRVVVTLSSLLLISGAGALFTLPPIDSGAYWPLVHTPAEIRFATQQIAAYARANHHLPPTIEESPPALFGPVPDLGFATHAGWPRDAWYRPFIYKVINPERQTFVVYSAGPDGEDDGQGGDDVVGGAKAYKCELYQTCPGVVAYANSFFLYSFLLLALAVAALSGRGLWKFFARRVAATRSVF